MAVLIDGRVHALHTGHRGAASARTFANLIERFLAGDGEFIVTEGDGGAPDIIDFNTLGAEARTYLANSCLN
ncbi:hypothetical protein, partial [Klebsiella pneumoniae]